MPEDKTYTATIDRIEDGIAVLLLEDRGETVDELHIHNLERIPSAGRHGGAILQVTVEEGNIVDMVYNAETEQNRRKRVQERFDNLSKRPPDTDSETN